MNKLINNLTLSIVSHRNGMLVNLLLSDIKRLKLNFHKIIITLNIPESDHFFAFPDLPIFIIKNSYVKGFGANHNSAFLFSESDYFCVINPDVRLNSIDFDALIKPLIMSSIGVTTPAVYDPNGHLEDNARKFPTFFGLLTRNLSSSTNDFISSIGDVKVDWIAGVFMLFTKDSFLKVKGFDERFHMYFEDVDICKRLTKSGYSIMYIGSQHIIHAAQRKSKRNILYFAWHFSSMFKYFYKNLLL